MRHLMNWPATIALPGAVSEGTLNPEHLSVTYLSLVEKLDKTVYTGFKLQRPHPADFPTVHDYDQAVTDFMVMLYEWLEEQAPRGYRFGSIEGDGACIGFWEDENDGEGEPFSTFTSSELLDDVVRNGRSLGRDGVIILVREILRRDPEWFDKNDS